MRSVPAHAVCSASSNCSATMEVDSGMLANSLTLFIQGWKYVLEAAKASSTQD